MLNDPTMPIKITTANYEVIASGIVHCTTPEVKFEIANIVIKYIFKSDSSFKEARMSAEINNNELIILLFNYSNSLGQGKLEPMEIGTLGNRRLFASHFVNTIEENKRQFNYTFYLME